MEALRAPLPTTFRINRMDLTLANFLKNDLQVPTWGLGFLVLLG